MDKRKRSIEVAGVVYPCYVTMGALLRYKRETGRDVTALGGGDWEGLLTLLWCCVASSCSRDGVAFDTPLLDFADLLTLEEVTSWASGLGGGVPDGADASAPVPGEKKSD